MKPRFASRIQKPAKPYRPSFDTNVGDTIKAERKRLAAEEVCRVVKAPTVVDDALRYVGTVKGVIVLGKNFQNQNSPKGERYRKD